MKYNTDVFNKDQNELISEVLIKFIGVELLYETETKKRTGNFLFFVGFCKTKKESFFIHFRMNLYQNIITHEINQHIIDNSFLLTKIYHSEKRDSLNLSAHEKKYKIKNNIKNFT